MLSQIIVGVAIAVLAALLQAVVNELVTPALREWRERRKAAGQVPDPKRKQRIDRDLWLGIVFLFIALALMAVAT